MESTNDILYELKEISPVIAAIGKLNVYTVPQGYFEVLSEDILAGLRSELGLLSSVTKEDSEGIPQGYFEDLAGRIMNQIKTAESETAAGEIRALSPMLYSIQNENVFEVPAGYFEGLSNELISKLQPQQARVVVMKRRTSVFFRYAVAAIFTGFMALGVFKFTTPGEKNTTLPSYVIEGQQIKDVDQELSKLSDEEIMKYLEANGTDVKTALVVNSVDENKLPAEEDYLLDEQALDKYLNSINLEETKN